ncbi:MAG: hypothetical protein AAF495_29185 [Pseudomonadota bacterium]
MIFEGDHGGTIYLTVPVSQVGCGEATLRRLLLDIDALYWANDEGTGLFPEPRPANSGVIGGMGGGLVLDKL